MVVASPNIKKYFNDIEISVNKAYTIAKEARSKGLDPEKTTAIPVAKNMAERVVGLISVVAPQIVDSTVTKRIIELEKKYGQLDWRVGFVIAEEVAKEIFCKFKDRQEAMEIGIRIGFAYLTLGIVSAPLEGFIGLKIKKRRDGKEYFALQYAGPIRAAGGTASSTSVILSDYVRIKLGYAPYDPEDIEINRYTTEIHDYHDRVTNLQYHPSDEELKFMISHLPVEVDGDPTEKFEVSNYKDLPRIETNLIRGGVALVIAEGLTQKAPKLWKRISKWGKEMGLEWGWLEEFIKLKEKIHASHSNKKNEDKTEKKTVKANNTFIMDLVAGRPILTHPLREGGFRLRYGRCRTSGFSAAAVNPATLTVLNKYIAIGTQLKIERPGKAATITLCDTIDGPIVRLEDGTVMALNTEKEAKLVVKQIEEIIFLGDFLFNYGDFSENGHSLVPVGYCPEWWSLEVEKATPNKEIIEKIFIQKPLRNSPSFEEAVDISKKFKVPLHPDFTFHWKLVNKESLENLIIWLKECKIKKDGKNITKIILPFHKNIEKYVKGKKVLEFLGVPHQLINTENIVIEKEIAQSLALSLNFDTEAEIKELQKKINKTKETNGLKIINFLSEVKLRDKSGTFIGARMGRPEKSKMRHLTGSPQVMFPVGEEGDRLRSFQSALEKGKIRSTFPTFYCKDCDSKTIYISCEICKKECIKLYNCRFCGDLEKKTCRHGDGFPFKTYDLDVRRFFNNAKKVINANIVPDLIKGVRGTSNKEHVVEHLAKGLLRAKHEIYVNKDGTTRYDCTELPLTHFKPKEIKTSIKKLKELGYDTDIEGKNLENENQLLELKPQDIIIPGHDSLGDSGPEVMKKVANFIDDLLVNFYGLKPFYNIKSFDDLAGHLVIGLAPHISAGMVGRIIGFSETQGLLTSPMYHAGMRRDCVHPNTEFVYNCDGKLKKEKIGKFTEKIIKNGTKLQKVDSFGTLKIKCDKEYYVYGINPLTNKLKLKKVKFFLKAPKPEKWVRIKTKTSRKFIMTPTHDFMHVIKKKLVLKKAKFAKEGDLIPLLNLRKNKDQTKKKIYALTFNKKLFNKTYFSLEGKEDLLYDEIVKVDFIEDKKNAYCLEIEYNSDADKNILWGEQIINTRCDGDEACVMLLMDALLNFSRQYLPERRGAKSITPDTLIYYKKNNKIKTEKIGSLVDSLLILHQDKVCYDTDYEILELAGYQAISFDAQTQKTNFYPITKFIRHNSPKIIYEIKSSHGKIKTTGDHSIFVTTGKKIVKKEVRNLKEGEFIVTLGKINLPTKKFKKLDLCKIAKDIIYVKLNKDYSKKVKLLSKKKKKQLIKKWKNNYYRYLNGTRKTPWQFIIDCDINFDGNEIYVKESIISMPRYLNINLNLVQLISYLISEGYLREKKYCEIVNTDLKIIQEVKKSLEGILKRKLKINWDCRIGKKKCGRIRLPAILRDVLICLGVHPVRSNQKRLPSFLFLLSNEFKEEFLRCYVNGDGHDYKHKNFKMLYSNSEFLSAELSLLAHSLNYKTSINSGKRVNQILYSKYNNTDPWWPLNDFTKELYGALRKEGFVKNEISKMLNNYYKNVRSKSASKFAIKKLIDLLKHKKNKSLRAKMELIYNSDIKVERIRKIRKFKSAYKYVYDLEVPPHQNFLCGPHPIFAHNTMDSPLVLTSVLDPAEIDDQVHGMDVVWKYPLELYEAALEMKNPWEVKVNDKKIEQLGDRLGTEQQYENFGFTHNVDNFNKGIQCSAYKTIPSMELKLFGQMDIARKVRAVDLNDVAKLVIQKHFLKDIKGNLRKFSMQQFRCVKCNEKYRRPPLSGICSNCNGKLIFTISEGSVVKYLGHSLNLSEKYDFSPYLKQTIDVLKENIEKVFGKEKDKQIGLSGFIN